MIKTKFIVNGWTIIAYTEETCRLYGIPYPTYAAFYACVDDYNPTCEECSFGTLEELIDWCIKN